MKRQEGIQVHFVGVGGIGMSGIAEVLLNQGIRVTGSDRASSELTQGLERLGAKIFVGHEATQVHGAQVVVVSSAIRRDNVEVLEARRLRIPVIPRAEMLGELMRGKSGIAVAGTHGKTTTTSMLATVLTHAGLDPTLIIGGRVDSLGGHAKLGQGQYLVAEADESDGSFLQLPATYGIITNIDNDHLDHYGDLQAIDDAFVQFVGRLPFYGKIAVCGDDSGVKRCLGRFTKPFMTYGFSTDLDLFAIDLKTREKTTSFNVFAMHEQKPVFQGEVTLSVPGEHNVLNALAVIAIATELKIPFLKIADGLKTFQGVKRRFDIQWENKNKKQMIVDDYGHHPTEIVATLKTARKFWPGRIITLFQPHRYSRTLHCHDEFLSAFHESDVVGITDIYAAGEEMIPGVSSVSMVSDLKKVAHPGQEIIYAGNLAAAYDWVEKQFSEGDLVLFLGAGSITTLAGKLTKKCIDLSEGESV